MTALPRRLQITKNIALLKCDQQSLLSMSSPAISDRSCPCRHQRSAIALVHVVMLDAGCRMLNAE